MVLKDLKSLLDREVFARNSLSELSDEKPDPLIIAREYKDDRVALISALFAYGKASLILKFLRGLDFSLLDGDEVQIRENLSKKVYRFQKAEDIIAIFIALQRLSKKGLTLEAIFLKGFESTNSVLGGISEMINEIEKIYPYHSDGYKFLLGSRPNLEKLNGQSPYKRWNLFLRWMVRNDNLDLGLWKSIDKKDLLIPLDTHTFNLSKKFGLLKRRTYDLKAVVELTESLKEFDPEDPVKYDFAIYRLGQEKLID